ncbi:unnamed protein product [Darwinula stevensoni]|uniref:Ig-like domain-containing protein n=1 Tax=Darwinula stevensoni TaxID=69355 RepID=A0A7R9A268_9CRUS|nr:unnamed protein product [Darwinula stevensoni]CAG0885076.1 unnamed protein product [Darwinula stevensoni]
MPLHENAYKSTAKPDTLTYKEQGRSDPEKETRWSNPSPVVSILGILDKNIFTEMPDLGHMENQLHLSLAHNNIYMLNGTVISRLPGLEHLDLSHNKIIDIFFGALPLCPKLKSLILSNNDIVSIEPGSLGNVTALEDLRMSKNSIKSLPKRLFQNLTNLIQLDLNRNDVNVIEGLQFEGLNSLRVLKLRKNHISILEDGAFFGLLKIEQLHLDWNEVRRVRKGWLFGLESLEVLSLSHNQVELIEDGAWDKCHSLVSLDLSHNRLEEITQGMFSQLGKLETLNLEGNQIHSIQDAAFRPLSQLLTLSVFFCLLHSSQELHLFHHLTGNLLPCRDLHENNLSWTIEDSSGAFQGLGKLTKLGLQSNNIMSVAEKAFSGLRSLRKLDLLGNSINTIEENPFSPMKGLAELNLNTSSMICDCKAAWLPSWLSRMGLGSTVDLICLLPEEYGGKHLTKIPTENFTCSISPRPRLIKEPESPIALAGKNLTLECKADSQSSSPISVLWKKDNRPLKSSEGFLLNTERALSNGGLEATSFLHLSNLTRNHSGQYQCIISNTFGTTYSQKAKITVYVFPYFTKKPMNLTVRAGTKDKANLVCAADGYPKPEIRWDKEGGKNFPSANERRLYQFHQDHQMTIMYVQPEDAGVYTCKATNAAGTISTNFTLTVLDQPSIVRPMRDKTTKVGDTAVLECMANGSPTPSLAWKKDDIPLLPQTSKRYFFTSNNQLLIIVDTQMSDAGNYECEMVNSLGKITDKAYLTVTAEGEKRDKSTAVVSGSWDWQVAVIVTVIVAVVVSACWLIVACRLHKRAYDDTPSHPPLLPSSSCPPHMSSASSAIFIPSQIPFMVPG